MPPITDAGQGENVNKSTGNAAGIYVSAPRVGPKALPYGQLAGIITAVWILRTLSPTCRVVSGLA